jgi:hypothetical protein
MVFGIDNEEPELAREYLQKYELHAPHLGGPRESSREPLSC